MTGDDSNRHIVQPEDAQRLNRLSEEVRSRLTEMALIIARISGSEYSGGPVTKFIPREGAQTVKAAAQDWLEIVEIVPGLDCCYGSIDGQTILECPCRVA